MNLDSVRIGIIGKGRVGGALALLIPGAAVASRMEIASLASVDLAIIAVRDDAIETVAEQLVHAPDYAIRVALHTSGAAGPEALSALRAKGTEIGVLHPLQTVTSADSGARALPGSSFAYAGDALANNAALALIKRIGGVPLRIDPRRWNYYHAAAVMVSNYQAALVEAALQLMEGAGVARETALGSLRPLIEQSTENIVSEGPGAALTGPIRRGDLGTVLKHIAALKQAPEGVRELYAVAGMQTVQLAERAGLSEENAREIAKALAMAAIQ